MKKYTITITQPYQIEVEASSAEAAMAEIKESWEKHGVEGGLYTALEPLFSVEEPPDTPS